MSSHEIGRQKMSAMTLGALGVVLGISVLAHFTLLPNVFIHHIMFL